MKRHAPATARNREPIAEVLRRVVEPRDLVLELASGTGEHAVYFARELDVHWQPSDRDPDALASIDAYGAEEPRVRPAVAIDACDDPWAVKQADAVVCINMVHISPIESSHGLFRGASRVLQPGAPLITYGPYRIDGEHTAPSNVQFEKWLKSLDERFGVRDVGELEAIAASFGMRLEERVTMPANNFVLVWRR